MHKVTRVKGHEFRADKSHLSSSLAHSTIGAGDTFIAGILYGLVMEFHDYAKNRSTRVLSQPQGMLGNQERATLKNLLDFAVRLATKKVQMEGFSGII